MTDTPTPTPEAVAAALPHRGDGIEQDAFEAWAKFEHYDMTTHPLHWLFLDPKTDAARYGWAAGLAHASDRMRPIVEALAADRDAQTARADAAERRFANAERMLTQAETTLTAERDKVAKLVEALIWTDMELAKLSGLWFDVSPRKQIRAIITEVQG